MKKQVIFFLCAIISLELVACTGKDVAETEAPSTQATETQSTETSANDVPEPDSVSQSITEDEKLFFTQFIQENANYGFLMSEYATANELDLDQLFYNGAGMCEETATDEQIQDYLTQTGNSELFTDLNALTTAQINEFLSAKTGLSYADMKKPLGWIYSAATDTYYNEAGDTNYEPFSCVDGTVSGDIYTLQFQSNFTWNGFHSDWRETVLKKVGNEYLFVSNRIMTERNLIEEQTYDVTHETLGNITFASYDVDQTENGPNQDVTFRIMQDGEILQTLYGPYSDNYRPDDIFDSVKEVAFMDINNDDQKDIIAIVSYCADKVTYDEVRLYYFSEYGSFVYDDETSNAAESALAEISVDSVLGFLGFNK